MIHNNRKFVIRLTFILIAGIYLAKLFAIQVLSEDYQAKADSNIIDREVRYPFRGLIYDRNGKLIVYNAPVYNLEVVPKDVQLKDTLAFCEIFEITQEEFDEKLKKAKQYSYVKPSVFIKQISNNAFASVQDYLVDFPGFRIQARTN